MSEEHDEHGDVNGDEFDEPFVDSEDRDPTALEFEELVREFDRLEHSVYDIRGELSRFEQAVEDRTVEKPQLESELRRYVRQRMRRNRARGWGPYLVLLYGTIMTLGAFYFLGGGWAILAMIVVWLSTLGLYVLMLLTGFVLNMLGIPGRAKDAIAKRRS